MSRIDRDPKDLLILDNSPNSYLFQPESALPIVSWYDDLEDTLLYEYIPILQGLSVVDDVREALMGFVYPNEQMEYDRIDLLRGTELLQQFVSIAVEGLIPEYESKNQTRVFSEPRNFQNNLMEEEVQPNKTFAEEPNNARFVHNSAVVKPSGNFSKDIMNTWTNSKVSAKNVVTEKPKGGKQSKYFIFI